MNKTRIAIIGGSGLCTYPELKSVEIIPASRTGASDDIIIGDLTGSHGTYRVAFLPRHGQAHHLLPHQIPYAANVMALKKLGVTAVLGTCVVGSLKADIRPGDAVVPDQFVDRTWGRDTDFDFGREIVHLPMNQPYCENLRQCFDNTLTKKKIRHHPKGTVVVIQGPRFNTLAESYWFSGQGWDIVNMTQYPEQYYMRAAGLCYAVIAMVTDYDNGIIHNKETFSDGSMKKILVTFRRNIRTLRDTLPDVVEAVAKTSHENCSCARPLPKEYYK